MRAFWAAIGILVISAIAWAAWEQARPEAKGPAAERPEPRSPELPPPDPLTEKTSVQAFTPPPEVESAHPDSSPAEGATVPPVVGQGVDEPAAVTPPITKQLDIVSQAVPQTTGQSAPSQEPGPAAAPDPDPSAPDKSQDSVSQPAPEPRPTEEPVPAPAAPTPEPPSTTAPVITAGGSPTPAPGTEPAPVSSAPRGADAKGDPATKDDTAAPAAGFQTSPTPADIQTKDDGSLLIDKRFVVKGKGTREEPYKVTWDLLVSAQEDFQPKQGRKNLPQRVMMLDGKHVEISGNIAFPMMAQEPRELLAMLNPWDGCCIGIPPTPYDAVEVSLKSTVTGDARFTTFGSVKGVLKVDPHMVGNWLVGLYVMKDGELTPKSFGGFAP